MSLIVLLVVSSLASFVLLWGVSIFLQGYLYNTRTDKLPMRAAIGGLILGCFLTLWTFINVRADIPNKYGTIIEFNDVKRTPIQQFKAVRFFPNSGEEQTATYQRLPAKVVTFGEVKPDGSVDETKTFRLNDSQFLTTAIIVIEPGKPESRFDAELKESKAGKLYKTEEKFFREKDSKRFILGENFDNISAPSGGAIFGAFALNILNFLVWFAVFWPVLRYGALHSVGLAFVGGIATMVALMPLLFVKFARVLPNA